MDSRLVECESVIKAIHEKTGKKLRLDDLGRTHYRVCLGETVLFRGNLHDCEMVLGGIYVFVKEEKA